MKECEWSGRIEAAAGRDAFGPEERAHVGECVACRELAGIVALLRAEGRSAERAANAVVPSAREILAAARPFEERAKERRVLRPIVWLERVAAVLGVMAALGVGWWLLRRMGDSTALALVRGSAGSGATSPDLVSASIMLTAVAAFAVAAYGLTGHTGLTAARTRRPR
jgi:predicted anti-sigma-YlaC factor YlaD